jgi:hypothetical protein
MHMSDTARRTRSLRHVLSLPLPLPLMLAVLAGCGGPEPAAPNGAAPPMEFGRGGTKGSTGSLTLILDVQGLAGQPVPFYDPTDITFRMFVPPNSSGTKISPSRGTAILDDDTDPTLSNTRTWPSLAAGEYDIEATNWPLNSMVPAAVHCDPITASPGDPALVEIRVQAGQRVVCTYVFENFVP